MSRVVEWIPGYAAGRRLGTGDKEGRERGVRGEIRPISSKTLHFALSEPDFTIHDRQTLIIITKSHERGTQFTRFLPNLHISHLFNQPESTMVSRCTKSDIDYFSHNPILHIDFGCARHRPRHISGSNSHTIY